MARLRYTRAEAEVEAARLATEYVQALPDVDGVRLHHVSPVNSAPKSNASKLPVVWSAMFVFPSPAGAVVDGGELIVTINIETKAVTPFP
jgi:hypothetical protein